MNKFLFYADFAYYKYFGRSISGSAYAAIPNGPVPDQYEYKFSLLAESKIISLELDTNLEAERFVACKSFRQDLFEKDELSIMEIVLDHLKFKKTSDIIELSHNEAAWKSNIDGKKLISYQAYAPKLIEF